MIPVVNVVHSSAESLMPADTKIPGCAWGFFSAIHKVHRVWRWYTKAKIYSNPDNFYKLVGGHVLNLTMGDNVLLRIAAQCVLIVTRILKCVNQMVALTKAYHNWIDAIKGNYTHYHSMKKISPIYENSTKGCLSATFGAIIERVKRIAIATFHLLKCLFKLSMCFMDAIESFSLSPTTRNESINELFVNSTSFIDDLVKNQRRLLDCLEDNHNLVSQILEGIGSPMKVNVLTDALSKSLAAAETVQTVANAGGGIIKKTAKNAIFGAAAMIGMAKHLPLSLVPTEEEEQVFENVSTATENTAKPVSMVMQIAWTSKSKVVV